MKPQEEKKTPKKRELPEFSAQAAEAFEFYSALDSADRTAFIAHALDLNRRDSSAASKEAGKTLEIGQRVRIVSGSAKHIGKTGTIVEARRTRVFVEVDGVEKVLYLYAVDVTLLDTLETADEEPEAEVVNG